jgi:hypothetical protein
MTTTDLVTNRPHARARNALYNKNAANYVTLKERWNNTLAALPIPQRNSTVSKLKNAIKAFRARYPNIKSFNEPSFRLCRAIPVHLDHLWIDTTIQRHLDLDWVIKIVESFVVYQAMPVQVYRVAAQDLPGVFNDQDEWWASWDGQHTAVAFWIIATMIFQQAPEEVTVPVVEYDMRNRLECRMTFIQNNSKEGKKIMAPIDLAMQKIYGVRLDHVQDPNWMAVEQKQTHLESVDLFLTDSKFHDDHEPGAITRAGDVCDEKYSPDLIRQFGIYAARVLDLNPRPVNAKELPIVLGFLKMAQGSNINYSDDEIRSLADLCMELFEADFDERGAFWDKACAAYINWHNDYHADMDENLRPGVKLNKDWAQGGTFFWYQLTKSWRDAQGNAMRMPKLNISTSFRPKTQDLW